LPIILGGITGLYFVSQMAVYQTMSRYEMTVELKKYLNLIKKTTYKERYL